MLEKYFSEGEKHLVLDWMRKYCYGVEQARYREDRKDIDGNVIKSGILPYMPEHIHDRKWRRIISALIQEGHVYSSASFGYFFMPTINASRVDIEAAMQALTERKVKALSTIEKVDQNFKKLEAQTQGVRELFPF